jgi:hypothetical protein
VKRIGFSHILELLHNGNEEGVHVHIIKCGVPGTRHIAKSINFAGGPSPWKIKLISRGVGIACYSRNDWNILDSRVVRCNLIEGYADPTGTVASCRLCGLKENDNNFSQ